MIKMLGTCKLCDKDNIELKDGHILPKHLYSFINTDNNGFYSYNGTLGDTGLLQITQRQFKKYLFCKPCEDLLSDKETHVPNYLRFINSTPLKDRELFSTKIPLDPSIVIMKEFMKSQTSNKGTIFDYFDKNKLDIIKFYSLSILLRQYFFDPKTNLPHEMASRIKNYINGKNMLNVQMFVLINTNKNDFPLVSMPYNLNSDGFFHSSLCIHNMFIHLHYREDQSIKNDEYVVLPDDFYNLHETSIPLKASLEYFRKYLRTAKKSQNAKDKIFEL